MHYYLYQLVWVAIIGMVIGAFGGVLAGLLLSRGTSFSRSYFGRVVLVGMTAGIIGSFIASTFSWFPFLIFEGLGSLIVAYLYGRKFRGLSADISKAKSDVGFAANKSPEFQPSERSLIGQVFLSYAREDRELAKTLAGALNDEGWSVWWDRSIPPGKSFDEVIESALNAAKCVIVLWSEASAKSDWVKNEAREGMRRRILIPATIADVPIPFEFRHIQAGDLTGWPTASPHAGFQSLVASIASTIGKSKPASGASAS